MKKACRSLIVLCVTMLIMSLKAPLYVEAADLTGNAEWKWPVPDSNTLSSCYMDGRNHYAIDIRAAKGSEVYACFEGEVIDIYTSCSHNYGKYYSCGCNGGLGNSISIHHTYNGVDYVSRYGHLTSVEVSVGDIVTEDMVIGTIGSTGYSGNHHLDFRIYRGSSMDYERATDCVDPLADLFLEIPEGLNANKASTGCCYSYVWEVNELYREYEEKKLAEKKARQEAEEQARQRAFENAVLSWAEEELTRDNYLQSNLVEVGLGFETILHEYE